MDRKEELLNEESYQRTSSKIRGIGTVLLCGGLLLIITGIVMIAVFKRMTAAFMIVIGMAMIGFGAQAKLIGNSRKITAYMTQQQMPVVTETMEKMAPAVGKAGATVAKEVAPVYGEVAKEIVKGIKEGKQEEATVFCKHCGAQIDADSKFCKVCGKEQ